MMIFSSTLAVMVVIIATYLYGRERPRLRQFSNYFFLTFFAVCTAGSIFWLTMGLIPAVASAFPSLHAQLHEWGGGDSEARVEAFNSQTFVQNEIVLLAGQETTIRFSNYDPTTPHNVSIYRDPWSLDPIFVGQYISGPSLGVFEPNTISYTFTAPAVGTYFFQDDLHPEMNGAVTVVANREQGSWAGLARRIAAAAHQPDAGREFLGVQLRFSGQIVLEYLISILNVGLGIFLIRLRPHDWAARLLALGMVGTAAILNVQAHTAFVVVPDLVDGLYDNFHLISGLAYLYALVLFPDGKLTLLSPTATSRWFSWPLRIFYLSVLAFAGLNVGWLLYGGDPVGYLAFFGLVIPIAGITAQAIRFRQAVTQRERQQSRALVWALSLALVVSLVFGLVALLFNLSGASTTDSIVEELRRMALVAFPLLFAMIPITLVAIMVRYRLWDVDRFINRTLVYGGLTVVLGVGYVGLVVLLQQVLSPLARGSDVVIAISTLVVAALFRPIRNRIQLIVDRHFYRHKYDAARTIEAFSHRLREELDLDSLTDELVYMVQSTMQPESVSIWLRPPRPIEETDRLRRA